jgi:flagellar biosynthesis protein FlhF
MGQASAELGADAVLMHSRKTPAELRHLGPYEVVFALPQAPSQTGAAAERSASPGPDPQVALELMQMRRQIEEMRRAFTTRGEVRSSPAADSMAEKIWRYLTGAAVDEDLAREIADRAALSLRDRASSVDESCALSYFVRPEMERRLKPEPVEESWPEGAPVFALVGPPGSGKTTSLIKLTVALQDTYGSDVHLVSADSFRIGAADQLRSYAAILGADLDVAESGAALRRHVELRRKKGPVLIDTPGLSSADFELMSDLAPALAGSPGICKLLVLPAVMRARDLRRLLREYDVFRPDRLMFTRLDETDLFGSVYSAAAWSGLPVSYLSAGQQIPGDLERGSPARILELVLGPETVETNLVN